MSFRKATDPIEELAQQIAQLQAEVRDLRRPLPFRIPVLTSDPPTTDPTNMWMFPDGRIRARHLNTTGTAFVTREWVPTTAGSSTSSVAAAPPATAPTTHLGSWTAQWTQSYQAGGTARADGGAVNLYYGYGDATNGRNRSLIGFDYAAIATALAGAEIIAVSLYMVNLYSGVPSGSYVSLGIHNFSAEPASWAGGGIPRSMLTQAYWGAAEEKTQSLPLEFAQAIRDGWGKGIALESPSDSVSYYGYMGGVGSGYQPPVLYVQYAK